jgi:histidinol-phosphate aminotransferase
VTASKLAEFWARARAEVPALPEPLPGAWSFGATAEQADELLALVLGGSKTGTASSAWDYAAEGEPLPVVGELSVILDGAAEPRAVVQTVAVAVVPFNEVDESHAFAEGEGDRSLAHWRRVHENFWREHSARGFAPDMPVVCERFELIYRP